MTYLFHRLEKYPYVDKLTMKFRRFLIPNVFNGKGIICVIPGKAYLFCIIIFKLTNHVHLPCTGFYWPIFLPRFKPNLFPCGVHVEPQG
jgi:hypothetical protein